jgi:bis(5'-adenosyl)-triphosphatase
LVGRVVENVSQYWLSRAFSHRMLLFHKFPVTTQVFHHTAHTFALVNLKPIVPGHVLVVPLRRVSRLHELPAEESDDFWRTVQRVQRFVQHIYKCDALNVAIQDGIAAGQSVPHVHCHLIPRYLRDGWGDGVYAALEDSEGMLHQEMVEEQRWWKKVGKQMDIKEDDVRKPRGMPEMEKEAQWLEKEMRTWLESEGEWKDEYGVDVSNEK